MSRYLLQRDKSSCGPLAIIHALQWQGLNVRRVHMDQLKELLRWRPRHGVTTDNLNDACVGFGYKYFNFTLKNLDHILDKGGAAIVRFGLKGRKEGHAGFIDYRTPKRFYGPNIGPGQYLSRQDLSNRSKHYHSFEAWEVKPLVLGDYQLSVRG